ncbi:MAG: hypothetical protein WAW91_03235 [Candidatus Nanoperiomorbaceae bacterium]
MDSTNAAAAGVNEEELNAMIANLQNEAGVHTPPSQVVVPPANAMAPAASTTQSAPTVPATAAATVSPNPTLAKSTVNPAPATSSDPLIGMVPGTTATATLDNIKNQALTELRPLVDKLNLAPADKFDVLLLMIRSSDDSSLVPEAHAVAKNIPDEARKAQALLDIIKEIDFFDQK